MDPLTVSVASGMRSRMESLDLLANNLANSGTPGYKKDIESYSLYLSEAAAQMGAGDDPATAVLPVIDGQWTDFSQGVLQTTGNPLDVGISGNGFLAVDGPSGTAYTRSGRLRITSGRLETADGYPVRLAGGVQADLNGSLPVEISRGGQITQGGQFVGQLELVGFDDSSALSKSRGPYFETRQTPKAADAEVLQGRLESSNVNTAESAVRLINVMRQFEMLSKAAAIGAEMNRQAVEQVAKVGP
jgi:flagellar basal-body rod protein FlgF